MLEMSLQCNSLCSTSLIFPFILTSSLCHSLIQILLFAILISFHCTCPLLNCFPTFHLSSCNSFQYLLIPSPHYRRRNNLPRQPRTHSLKKALKPVFLPSTTTQIGVLTRNIFFPPYQRFLYSFGASWMRVLIMSKGCVILVARRPAIAPEGILSNGPDEGEFNGDARISPPFHLKHTQSASYKE